MKVNHISDIFFKAVDLFIDCVRTNKSVYIAIIVIFCLSFTASLLCFVTYNKNKQNSDVRLKMIAYTILLLNCFCISLINLLFLWQIAIPLSLITVLLVNRERKICCDSEIKKQVSESVLDDENIVFNPFYTRLNFLFIISLFITVIFQIIFTV